MTLFGFLIKSQVRDDAVAIHSLAVLSVDKYLGIEKKELVSRVTHDFSEEQRYIDSNEVAFIYPHMPDFRFSVDSPETLAVAGNSKYLGFWLNVVHGTWACSVSDGIAYRATGGARMMAKVMASKFGIPDMTHFLSGS